MAWTSASARARSSRCSRNGVGRSTTIKAIMGDVVRAGSVQFKGRELIELKPHQIAHAGLGYVPENRDIFPTLTVRENLLLGQKGARDGGRWSMHDMYELFPRLAERLGPGARVVTLMCDSGLKYLSTDVYRGASGAA